MLRALQLVIIKIIDRKTQNYKITFDGFTSHTERFIFEGPNKCTWKEVTRGMKRNVKLFQIHSTTNQITEYVFSVVFYAYVVEPGNKKKGQVANFCLSKLSNMLGYENKSKLF